MKERIDKSIRKPKKCSLLSQLTSLCCKNLETHSRFTFILALCRRRIGRRVNCIIIGRGHRRGQFACFFVNYCTVASFVFSNNSRRTNNSLVFASKITPKCLLNAPTRNISKNTLHAYQRRTCRSTTRMLYDAVHGASATDSQRLDLLVMTIG